MIKVTDCIIDAEATLGKNILLTGITPCAKYINGEKTEEIDAYRYTVCVESLAMEKIGIKIEGSQKIEMPDKPEYVTVDGADIYFYWRDGQPQVAAKARNIAFVGKKNNETKDKQL